MILGHIYIGTVEMEGAFEAMGTGEVDFNWAQEHHDLWLQEELAKGRKAARRRDDAHHPAACVRSPAPSKAPAMWAMGPAKTRHPKVAPETRGRMGLL
jgi:hypothetical protein